MSTVRACTVFDCCRSHRVKFAVFPIDFGVGCPPHQLYVDKKTLILGMSRQDLSVHSYRVRPGQDRLTSLLWYSQQATWR